MVSHSFAAGNKEFAIIIGPKYYQWNQFIGSNFGIPLKKFDTAAPSKMLTISTFEPVTGKIKAAQVKEQCADLLEGCDVLGISKLLVVSGEYFKYLSGRKTFEDEVGIVYNCNVQGYEHMQVMACINPAVILAQPNKKPVVAKGLEAFGNLLAGTYEQPKEFVFESYELVLDTKRLSEVISMLHTKPLLAVDIETTGLRVGPKTEVLTIAFAWDEYNAVTVACHEFYEVEADRIVEQLKEFFRTYQGATMYHNCLFDLKQLAFNWWMHDFTNYEGLYQAMEDLGVANVHDTMLLAYADLNSTDRVPLGLKPLTKDFLGDYAVEVKDCLAVPLVVLAEYNAKDVCGTFWLYNKYKHQVSSRVYTEILQPSVEYLLHEMINGLPIVPELVTKAIEEIDLILDEANTALSRDPYVEETETNLRYYSCEKYNNTHKGQKEPYEFAVEFNPGSPTQLRVLLFDVMQFTPVDVTETGAPRTDRASIKEFISECLPDDPRLKTLNALTSISETAIIKSTFLSTFLEISEEVGDGYIINGNHRLGGTMSGRLSSSQPNLANQPSNSKFGAAIKKCFVAPEGWLFCYADFNALEDRISTLLTKDPMKLKEVNEGFEGHSLRASFYFKDELAERGIVVDLSDKDSVNRIQTEAKDLRNGSKPITFLKIYGGGAGKIQKVLKCSAERAQGISDSFDDLYKVTKAFNDSNTQLAKAQGFLDVAFGLRVLCPTINSKDKGTASAIGRSVNNASTQSWGMLTNRSAIEFLERLKVSDERLNIKMINQIHDCSYFLAKENPTTIKWLNDNLIDTMRWKNDPALEGPVTMEAELDIGRGWYGCKTLANYVTLEEVVTFLGGIDDVA